MSKREWREAEELAARGRWGEAGAKYAAIVERARRVRDTAGVRQAAALAADAYRRDDRPALSAKMLLYAREAGRDEVADAAQLAAVLQEAGQVTAAVDITATAMEKATDPVGRTVALDTLAGLYLTSGRVEDARRCVDALESLALPGATMARRFRAAQLDRLDGLVARAEKGWEDLGKEMSAWPQAVGPEGACWGELAELDLIRASFAADPAPLCARAIERFTRAGTCWARAGRRAGALRAEAWALRAQAAAGETVLPTGIDRAISFADDRGMPLLSADLRVCRAVVTGDADEVLHALDRLEEAPLARGRARVVRAELGGAADLERALEELTSDGPWTARALRALGKSTGDEALLREAAERAASWG
jgi:hypothetical protein